jgi:CubicO group peptidase (beta-lactamase class C family)
MLMRDDGVFAGARLVAAGRLGTCLRGSAALPAYGLGWWLNAAVTPAQAEQIPSVLRERLAPPPRLFEPGPPDLFAAIGSDDQRLYVMPSRGLVVVRLARPTREAEPFTDAAFLDLLLR